jgi:hypothetical protein
MLEKPRVSPEGGDEQGVGGGASLAVALSAALMTTRGIVNL